MAIGRLTVGTGGKGKATSHAAYVARTGAYEKYLEKGEVLEAQAFGNMPAWAEHDPSVFWRAADAYERANGTAYREYLVSLPRELSAEQRIDLVEAFVAQEIGERHPYQYAIHVPKASDGLDNPHVHLMFSERRHDGIERDPEEFFKRYNAKSPEKGGAQKGVGEIPHTKLSKQEQAAELKAMRGRWEDLANRALAQAGHEVRISMKSYWERGLDIQPEPKQLPSQWKKGGMVSILAFRESRKMDLEARRQPGDIIDRVSSMKAIFTRADLYRELNKVTDDVELFNRIKTQLDAHPDLIPLDIGYEPGSVRETLTTQSVIDSEQSIRALGAVLSESGDFGLAEKTLDKALAAQPILSEEQISAVKHVTQDSRLSMIAGVAGAGKSTALSVVREGYESAGFRVSGMALAGKAADELQGSSGIESRTIASWLYRHDRGDIQLTKKDVVVLDEAGMVNNSTMERVLDAVNRAGAKAILVGDAEQLQPIQAGCPFRVLSEELKATEIVTVRRQNAAWQRQGTQDLSRGRGVLALKAYQENGCVHRGAGEDLVAPLVENYLSDPKRSAVVLAHRNKDVAMLNRAVRDARKERGELAEIKTFGELELAVGDRVVFLENDARLGVKNGQFGEVVGLSRLGSGVEVKRDDGQLVSFSMSDYNKIAHGYSCTIHKSQGMTVDRAMVWGSASLDRHLGYVAMSRHRERLDVYQPDEATRVRSLEQCLSRSNQAASVQEMMDAQGLEYRQDKDGRARLCHAYPTAADVDRAKTLRHEAKVYVRDAVATRSEQLNDAVKRATQALAEHQNQEPPGRRLRDALMPGANQRWVDWQSREIDLKSRVQTAEQQLSRWQNASERKAVVQGMMQERLNASLPDLLSADGGIERDADGGIVITDRYPEIARESCEKLLLNVESEVKGWIERERSSRAKALSAAERGLNQHRLNEPVDSELRVFLYQGAKAQREAWSATLHELEARVESLKSSVQDWDEKTKDGRYEKNVVWEKFSSKAPDQVVVNNKVIAANTKRVNFNNELSTYYWIEKTLESPLNRGDKKETEVTRDKLLKRFYRKSYQRRLPGQINVRAKEHRRSVIKSRELQRSLSRGHGMER